MKLNRRNFLFGSAAAATLAGCSTNKVGLRPLAAGEKRKLALIGFGMQQHHALMPQFFKQPGVEIVAVCDCDKYRRENGAKLVNENYKYEKCKAVADFRDIINDPEIDMVSIATPDHWHAYIAIEAMKRGKDVYCEKPLTYNVDEARKIIAAQEKYGRIFQCGSMQRSWDVFRTAVMVVRNGVIGDVKYVDANYGGKGTNSGTSHPMRFWENPENAAKECVENPNVDWDMWLGPAKWRPYSNKLAPADYKNEKRDGVHGWYPMFWRFEDDFGLGYNGDWGAHHLDIAQWGLDMDKGGPYKVIRSDEPHSANLYHGGRRQWGMRMLFRKPYGDVELYHGPFGVWGTVFYGTKGVVAVNRGKIAVWEGGLVKPTAEIRAALDELKDVADVRWPKENCANSQNILISLGWWRKCASAAPAVIQFNCGHWDVSRWDGDDEPITSLDEYGRNIKLIIRRLRRDYPGATVVFATTTPMNPNGTCGKNKRTTEEIRRYNAKAVEVARAEKVPVNDLFAFVEKWPSSDYADYAHFSKEANKRLGRHVAEFLKGQLQK